MGTFIGHLGPGLAFTLLGLWHVLNTIKSYKLRGPTHFTSRPWFPLPTTISALKHLELYLILLFSILAVAQQLLDHPLTLSDQLEALEHATMFLHVGVYASAALAAEFMPRPEFFSGLVGALAASAFGQELFLLHFHSADHVGVEGHYHWLMQVVVVISLLATIVTTGCPASFPAATVRGAAVLLQGLWFLDMAFALWFPRFVPRGCFATGRVESAVHGAVVCKTEDASRRAMALANLQFSWMVAGVSILTLFLCLRPDRNCMEYSQLQCPGVDVGQSLSELKNSRDNTNS